MENRNQSETERVEQLTAVTDRLAEIISAELAALKDRRPSEIIGFEEEKTRLARIYAAEITRLRKDPRLTRAVPRDVTKSLRHATERFRDLTARQEAMLLAMKTISERMIRDIASELGRINAPEVTYSRNATHAGARATPFALNKTA